MLQEFPTVSLDFTNKTNKNQTKQNNGELEAVQDKPFDELLMFIAAGKDSALPRTRKREVSSAPLADSNVQVPLSVRLSVICRITVHRSLNFPNSSKSSNLSKGFVLSEKSDVFQVAVSGGNVAE